MKATKIAGIPAGIVNNHNEVLYHWVKSGIKGATLFRVDAHSDMDGGSEYQEKLTIKSYLHFHISDFNCPAVYHGIVDSIYWLNPHSESRKLQDLGTVRTEKGRGKIEVILKPSHCEPEPRYGWTYLFPNKKIKYFSILEEVISPKDIKIPTASPLIADFDLDAFCTHKPTSIHNLDSLTCGGSSDYIEIYDTANYDGISGFEKRIAETTEILQQLPKPNLITIARSLGYTRSDNNRGCYVPHKMVKRVQECLIEKLKQIY
ncbi:MAG: UPF0489 family protein [Nanoarchaeota archaeon]